MNGRMNSDGLPWAVAVDFDGTLCESAWPGIGEARIGEIRRLKSRQAKGVRLILHTCREDVLLNDAIAWCAARGLCFDAVNENLPERIGYYGGDCRKISADEYLDDRAVRPGGTLGTDWVDKTLCKPNAFDGDDMGRVLAWDVMIGVRVVNYRVVVSPNRDITHWAPMIKGPGKRRG